jgi:hypothetical protein
MYNIYAVQVSNAYGSATSANAILTVNPAVNPNRPVPESDGAA